MAITKHTYQLPNADEKAGYVEQNFNEIARRYDLFNDLITFGLHRLWKKEMIRSAKIAGQRESLLLDLCCGTGDIAIYGARMAGQKSAVTAVDFSEEMLAVLRSRLARPGAPQSIDVERGDATKLEGIADGSFNAVTIGFGLRNVVDRPAALAAIMRVLRPGGRLVILDVGEVRNRPIRFFHTIFFERIVPIIGHLIHGRRHEMYEYLPASARVWPNAENLAGELSAAGFLDIEFRRYMFGSAVRHIAVKPGKP